jgi:hypothetical protein
MCCTFEVFGFHSRAITLAWGTSSPQQLEALAHQIAAEVAEAGDVAAGPGETGDQVRPDRVADAHEDDRDSRGCVFCRK